MAAPRTGLEAPLGTAVNTGSTFTFATTPVGLETELKVRLHNHGDGYLNLKSVYLDGTADFGQFKIVGLNNSIVFGGSFLDFSVKFRPYSPGPKRLALTVLTSNSSADNPFILNLVGTATAPSLQWQDSVGTAGLRKVVFPTIFGTGSQSQVVGIRNSGTGESINSSVSITGPDAASFSVTALPGTTIGVGEVKTVTVTFNPTSLGNKSAQLDFTRANVGQAGKLESLILTGSAMPVGPEIVVEEPAGTNRNSGDGLGFGEVIAGADALTKTVTIRNIGNQTLADLGMSISGPNAPDFIVTALPGTTVAAGSQLQFQITYAPALEGTKSALLRIAGNDTDENPFELNLSGTAVAPVASVARAGVAVAASGQTVPGLAGVTYQDFFQVQTNAAGECAFYATLSNGGTAVMSNGGLAAHGGSGQRAGRGR